MNGPTSLSPWKGFIPLQAADPRPTGREKIAPCPGLHSESGLYLGCIPIPCTRRSTRAEVRDLPRFWDPA